MKQGIGKEFMDRTRYKYLEESDQSKGLPQPPLELGPEEGRRTIALPAPEEVEADPIGLREAMENRRSVRDYAEEPLALAELSWLLWCTQGVKGVADAFGSAGATHRTVPSAGARHPLETYLLVNRVEGLPPGLYKFLAVDHRLVEVSLEEGLADRVAEACYRQRFIKECAAAFIWVAVAYRTTWRYVERGYRYMHLDAGHVCQNLYLAAEAIGCGACAVGAFYDEEINGLLGIDGEEQFVIYAGTVGKKK
ncbi:nitroreductase [miscellaneous Crenarchaeota group-15 archaeon DG-45]|uniref:Nitroreductase n=1 Tax=miscellaneous Crenarchaeota group-15 archaeon DG-45 TaxID=1685127 RepID=A0A0M0BSL4_9ARCH|nr:MAG: nitroreductase [miscellaneous Crenarchaeota group-15 archaeon DG-45]